MVLLRALLLQKDTTVILMLVSSYFLQKSATLKNHYPVIHEVKYFFDRRVKHG